MDIVSRTGFASSILALFAAASCCVLPMSLMVAGLGGSWLALLSPFVIASPYIVAASIALVALAFVLAFRRGASKRTFAYLSAGGALSSLGWVLLVSDDFLTPFFLSLM